MELLVLKGAVSSDGVVGSEEVVGSDVDVYLL